MKQTFFVKLIPPRDTFALDFTDAEHELITASTRDTTERFAAGEVLLFGLVPEARFALAVLSVADFAAAQTIAENNPSVRAGLNTFEVYRMHVFAAQASAGGASTGSSARIGAVVNETFFLKIIPPRPNFASDLAQTERELIKESVRYTAERFSAGEVLLFGPVFAPDAEFGMAILNVADAAAARALAESDPAVRAELTHFELLRMHVFGAQGAGTKTSG
jgi:uncharacterized protein YciI